MCDWYNSKQKNRIIANLISYSLGATTESNYKFLDKISLLMMLMVYFFFWYFPEDGSIIADGQLKKI